MLSLDLRIIGNFYKIIHFQANNAKIIGVMSLPDSLILEM